MFELLIEGIEMAFGPPMPQPPPAGLCYSKPYFPKKVHAYCGGACRPWPPTLIKHCGHVCGLDGVVCCSHFV